MKKFSLLILLLVLFFARCKKESTDIPDQDSIRLSGIDTINDSLKWSNELQTWTIMGFLFSQAKLVPYPGSPNPDITVETDGTLANIILQTNNYKNSFYLSGEFENATLAEQAFDNLTSLNVLQWAARADSLKANQIWVYKSGTNHYAKLRIISAFSKAASPNNYAECTFEWVYQPDGTLTFPAR
jgi:hypothetical protein